MSVYIVLQLPMRKASRQVIFINTSPPEEREELLKPLDDIKDMEDDCEDIYTNGLIKRYTMRPSSLEKGTLADWAAWYDMCGKPCIKQHLVLRILNTMTRLKVIEIYTLILMRTTTCQIILAFPLWIQMLSH